MSDHARSVWCGACAALLAIPVGCSSGGGTESPTAPLVTANTTSPVATVPTTSTETTTVGSTTAARTVSSVPSTSEPPADDVAAITTVFETFFGGSTSTLDQKVAVLEDGETYRGMLSDASENAQFQQMSTAIRSIVAGSDTACAALDAPAGCAIVTHDLLIGGLPMAAGIESAAIPSSDGGWLVAASAWCNVVAIGGDSCDAALDGTTP